MTKSISREDPRPDNAALDPKILSAIGRTLKAHYDDLLHAPLPEEFLDLLGRLEREEQRQAGGIARCLR